MINLGKPYFGRKEIKAVSKVIKSGWVGRGPEVEHFEIEFAKYAGAKYAIAVNGCTFGLFLSLKKLGIKAGDEVIVPSMTWNATAAVVVQTGATPVFADILPQTWCLDPDDVKRKITKKTKAIIPVHYAGQFAEGFDDFKIPVIYDSAHRIEKNGFNGVSTVHSLYVTKNITTVRGGMIVTNNKKEALWFRSARSSGINQDVLKRYSEGKYTYEVEWPSWNFDMTDIEAAIGRVQLTRLPEFNNKRLQIIEKYNNAFNYNNTGNHLFTILVNNRDTFINKLKENGVQCGVHYFALHKMKGYKNYKTPKLPVTEFYSKHNVSLPFYPSLKNKEINKIIRLTLKYAKFIHIPNKKTKYKYLTKTQLTKVEFNNVNNLNYLLKVSKSNIRNI